MSDLARWELRGPVRTLRTQFAEWNPETADWSPLKTRFVATFRADGQLSEIEHHNPDGSVPRQVRLYDEHGRLTEDQWWANGVVTSRTLSTHDARGRLASSVTIDADGTRREAELCRYDGNGRKTKVVFLRDAESTGATGSASSCEIHCGVEGTDTAYPAPGATTSTTTYDEHELPVEVSFHDTNNAPICRVVFSRGEDGRVQSERMRVQSTFFGRVTDDKVATDERESLAKLLGAAFEDQTLTLTTYSYDERGRRIETIRRMGELSEERTTFRYDDYDNPVEQVTVELSRDMRLDDGAVRVEERPGDVQHVRFVYQYDAYGNWIERVVWQRTEPDAEEQRSNIERRAITYYGD
jgi:YD repeat-containing protein